MIPGRDARQTVGDGCFPHDPGTAWAGRGLWSSSSDTGADLDCWAAPQYHRSSFVTEDLLSEKTCSVPGVALTCLYHKTFKGSTSNAFKTHQRLFKVIQHSKIECYGYPLPCSEGFVLIICRQGPQVKALNSPSTWPIYVLGRNSGLPFLCPPCIEGWGSKFSLCFIM